MLFFFSSRNGEQTHHDSMMITQIVAGVIYDNKPTLENLVALDIILREFAHVIIYTLLGFSAGLWVQMGQRNKTRIILLVIVTVVCVTVSFFDEWLKQYVHGRHFHINDFRLNSISALAGLLTCIAVSSGIRAMVKASRMQHNR